MSSLEPKSARQPVQNTSPQMQMLRQTKLPCRGSSTAEAEQVFNSPPYHYFQMYLAAKVYQSSSTSFGLKHIPTVLWVLWVYHIQSQELVQISPAANLPAVYPSLQLQEGSQEKGQFPEAQNPRGKAGPELGPLTRQRDKHGPRWETPARWTNR